MVPSARSYLGGSFMSLSLSLFPSPPLLYKAYGLAGRCEDARSMPGRAIAGGLIPDEKLYASVMNALGYNGFWREAVGVLQSMRRGSSQRGDGGEGAGGACAIVSGADPRVETVSEDTLAGAWPRPGQAAFGSACRACAAQGEWETVLGIMDDMREDGVRRTVSVYACAMRAFVEAGAWERAVELVKSEVWMQPGGRLGDRKSVV